MLSERARRYLSKLKRITPVPTAEVQRALELQGVNCYPAWLDFHERYAGYVEPLGFEAAVLGIVHARSRWIKPRTAAVVRSYECNAEWFVYCAEVHPSYVYKLGDTGFFRSPPASSFQMHLERCAAWFEFFSRPGAKQVRPAPPERPGSRSFAESDGSALIEELSRHACEVPEASDEHCRLLLSDRFCALQESATGLFIQCGACE
jgi:hypothetical protein